MDTLKVSFASRGRSLKSSFICQGSLEKSFYVASGGKGEKEDKEGRIRLCNQFPYQIMTVANCAAYHNEKGIILILCFLICPASLGTFFLRNTNCKTNHIFQDY